MVEKKQEEVFCWPAALPLLVGGPKKKYDRARGHHRSSCFIYSSQDHIIILIASSASGVWPAVVRHIEDALILGGVYYIKTRACENFDSQPRMKRALNYAKVKKQSKNR